MPPPETETVEPPPLPREALYVPDPAMQPPAATGVPSISFGNRQAVRTTMLVAAVLFLLLTVPWPLAPFFWVLWLLAAGFTAVWHYHKRTGEAVSMRGGVRLGWLTGVFCFVLSLVFFVTLMVGASAEGSAFQQMWRAAIRENARPGTDIEAQLRILESPAGMFFVIVFGLVFLFMVVTTLPMIGGAVGAKVLEKE